MREGEIKMFEQAFIKVGETIVRVKMIKSVYNTVNGYDKICVIEYVDGTKTLHGGIYADDVWEGLEKLYLDMKVKNGEKSNR